MKLHVGMDQINPYLILLDNINFILVSKTNMDHYIILRHMDRSKESNILILCKNH